MCEVLDSGVRRCDASEQHRDDARELETLGEHVGNEWNQHSQGSLEIHQRSALCIEFARQGGTDVGGYAGETETERDTQSERIITPDKRRSLH